MKQKSAECGMTSNSGKIAESMYFDNHNIYHIYMAISRGFPFSKMIFLVGCIVVLRPR